MVMCDGTGHVSDEPAQHGLGERGEQEPGQQEPGQQEPGQQEPGAERAAQAVMILLRLFRALERVNTDLTPQQYRILKLAGAGGERSARLAERLAVAKPTLTATADGLVAAGYARRETEPGDRRVVRLCLTDAGRDAVDRADAAYGRWLDQLLGQTAEPDQVLRAFDALDDAMDEVRRARQAAGKESRPPAGVPSLNVTPPAEAEPPADGHEAGPGPA
jgi:DNA-binding MarR family transcriptional regulator